MTTDVALKEWQAVCDLLADGTQCMLLRKGGIQEGPGGFAMKHRRFALLPTRLHQDPNLLRPEHRGRIDGGETEPAMFDLTHGGEVTDVVIVPSRASLDRLHEHHAWAEPYLDLRWNYRPERPLYLAVVRVFMLASPMALANDYTVAGCKSWVDLPEPAALGEAVLGDAVFTERRRSLLATLDDEARP
jgi:hypothetical protein